MQFFDIDSKKCQEIQEANPNETIETSFHHLDEKTLKVHDGTLPKCDDSVIKILRNPEQDYNEFILREPEKYEIASGLILQDLSDYDYSSESVSYATFCLDRYLNPARGLPLVVSYFF